MGVTMPEPIGAITLGEVGHRRQEGGYHQDPSQADTGCSLWGQCLSCPLPACRYEMTSQDLWAALERLTRPTNERT
jgi:hypothetical protein